MDCMDTLRAKRLPTGNTLPWEPVERTANRSWRPLSSNRMRINLATDGWAMVRAWPATQTATGDAPFLEAVPINRMRCSHRI
eukprot:Transcript_8690.p8 GENE.Transcript_8690~~Transcript_8690.p8  ORF type:complete len:82 (+),score=2.63 Transcript_8690:1095-1340(+)